METGIEIPAPIPWAPPRAGHRYWLHALLFALTVLSTTILGARIAFNFEQNLPAFDLEADLAIFGRVLNEPSLLLAGLPYSLTLMAILLAHEFGHYFACVYYRVDASLPYFLPAPTFIGTLGAFIRFRSPIYSRRVLFDVGFAGPIAGFLVLLPALAIGMSLSKIIPGISEQGDMAFGAPLLVSLLQWIIFPGVPSSDIYLHPVARAAWVGLLATSLNLLPIGQLDGGHILYAFFARRHLLISTLVCVALIPLGLLYWPWAIWGTLFLIFARRHFSIVDDAPLGSGRTRLGLLAVVLFVLCFIPEPVLYHAGGVGR
ncbi:MAG: site-2 protease family protein [Bryobacteraceae bacterium]|nr:site-2 protease family protein [Bryobacteraceae bacterium]